MAHFFRENTKEVIVSVLFVALITALLDPFMILMPSPAIYVLIALLVAVFVFFAGFVWQEKARDERDELHRMIAGRIGYLLGTGALLTGVVIETFQGHVDPWLILALAAMVIGKLAGLMYTRLRR
jgi:uncharacterized membrane protein